MGECSQIIDVARDTQNRRDQVQGHIFAAQICVFARSLGSGWQHKTATTANDMDGPKGYIQKAHDHIAQARALLLEYPPTASLSDEIERVDIMVNDGVFYGEVTSDELIAVYRAMSLSFAGTGHWYHCRNGHPFTIGECGMPMELARCPECDAPVGGQNHENVEGVERADDIERLAMDFDDMGVEDMGGDDMGW